MTHLYFLGDFIIGSTVGFYTSSTICLFANLEYESIFKYTAFSTGALGLSAMIFEIQDYLPQKRDLIIDEELVLESNSTANQTLEY